MSSFAYPQAERLAAADHLHGRDVADPYRWLEDPEDPRTELWCAGQDSLFTEARRGWPAVPAFTERLGALMATGDVSPPYWRGERRFVTRRLPDQEHAVLLAVEPDGTERVLVDPTALDPSGTTTLDGWQPSMEGDRLAYLISEAGTEESVLYVVDVDTLDRLEGPITRAKYTSVAWLPGGEAYYYARRPHPDTVPEGDEQYHRRVHLHKVGTDPDAEDVEIFGAGQPKTSYYDMSVTRDGRWLEVSAHAGTAPRDDIFVADLTASSPERPALTPVQVGVDNLTSVDICEADSPLAGSALLWTDRDAPRRRICVAPAGDLRYENWRELVPEDPEAVLDSYALLDGPELERPLLVVARTRHAVAELALHDAHTGEKVADIPLPGLGTLAGLSTRPEGGHELWFGYTDFTTPVQIHHFDARTRQTTVWERPPAEVEIPKVRTRQVTYTSKDGTEVRMFVIDGDDGDGDGDDSTGPKPTILYGYGGFNVPMTPGYSARILAWVQAGGTYAVANLRGGSEEGEEWHRAGMMENKQNVFDDFHTAGDWLVDNGVTTRAQLGIFGGSNGGLLVGAALTQHPEKYAAVVCWAPLLDMIRYEQFGLGVTWNEEFGTAEDPEQFGWLIAYSPYHNVHEGTAYPATLFPVFDGDSRVDPLHARKLAAALQHATSAPVTERPVLLRLEREAGHAARSVSKTVGVYADMWAFLAAQLGLEESTPAV
ncbi:prolyl oligopeptidase family serine peptidase [Catenulispora pinisilvae]|uniref:prolyl oligopeptidase family serine peptidase n=1 Tax=Catenulispora pinisilvae TaxID=2705253 RepID=UPI0018923432|nr:prolyl oligopeptidase family serine peptidase [Catenulispora pinisilvae]